MGYRIVYGREKRHVLRFVLLCAGFFALFLYCLTYAVQIDALDALAGQLAEGTPIGEAVAAFCQDVLHGR